MKRLSSAVQKNRSAGPFGSSASSLHAKTFSIDRQRAFIGSFNFDPRSMHLNTELGFVIDNTALASDIENALRNGIPERAYEVGLDEHGSLFWLDQGDDDVVRLNSEPNTCWFKRATVTVLAFLPIEWLL